MLDRFKRIVMKRLALAVSLLFFLCTLGTGVPESNGAPAAPAPKPEGIDVANSIDTFFETYCYNCHDADTMKADLNLEGLSRSIANPTDAEHWQDILDQLNAGEMPPKNKKQPTAEDLAKAVGDLTESLQAAQERFKDSGGQIALRRLNRREYEATIQDLMGIRIDGSLLPDDAAGRFDTIGQNQLLTAQQLAKYYSFAQEVSRTALHWASQPRKEPGILERKELANTEGRSKHIYEMMQMVKRVEEEGITPQEAGLTEAQWKKYDLDGPNAQRGVWRGQEKYYDRNRHIHDKGRMLSHDLLVESVNLYFPHDARAHYRLRFCGGVVEGIKTRRVVRVMEKKGNLGGKHGSIFASFAVSGTIENPSIHEAAYQPAFKPDFRPMPGNPSRRFVYALEDKRGGPASEQFIHQYRPIEPGAPTDTIYAKWFEVEGPFYDPPSPFELLVNKHRLADATDEACDQAARPFLSDFAAIAFRGRGVPDGLIDRLMAFYQQRRQDGMPSREALSDSLAMILTSTRFLYLIEPATPDKSRQLDAVAVANRLSYFLWSGPPDQALLDLAESQQLLKHEVLAQQVDRMLKSPKASRFHEGFMSQWMHLDRFDQLGLDSKLHLHRTDGMIHASREEPIAFFKTLVDENLSAANLIDSDIVTINSLLAIKYGLTEQYAGSGFQKVQLPEDSPRGGILTQAAFLSSGTMGNRTSPVIRGALLKEILLNDPPPPPPPNVPELVHAGTDPLASVRSLVALHQEKTQCASCHARFDFIGLGLENFDAVGLWRDEELVTEAQHARQIPSRPKKIYPIDASGSLPNGEVFDGVHGLKSALMKEQRKVAGSMYEGLLCYALGRDASFTDRPRVEEVLNTLSKENTAGQSFALRDMILHIVTSQSFLND
jgi:hypothetical protein